MPTNTNVTNLKINELTKAQFETAVQGGVIGANELSLITDMSDTVQVETMPTASVDELGKVYQFIGTTDANYTHGYFYECVSDGGNPATYSWSNIQVQASSGSSYTAGTGIDITNGTISVTAPTLQNTATGTNGITVLGTATASINAINIGVNSVANANNAIAYGREAEASGAYSVALGTGAKVYSGNNQAIQIGEGTNSTSGSFQVKSYTMMNSDGTIPTARLTKVNSTITLTVADWSSNTQTVNVTGMTATGVVFVSPDPTDQADYTSAGVYCTAQAAGTLTFTCSSVPSSDIDVNVVML